MQVVSLIGIILGLSLLIFLAFKGHSIIWVAPVCAILVALTGGLNILDLYLNDYMNGMAGFVLSWFPAFFLSAVFGKLMDSTGAARSLANKIVELIGPKFALLAVIIPCLLMTYGGISLFVVVFVIYPMGYEIFKKADLPRTLLPGAIAFGAFGITMTAIPGSPQIQNLIPTSYYGTTAMAAPLMSLIAIAIIAVPSYIYLDRRVKKAKAQGLHFVEDPNFKKPDISENKISSWHWLSGLLPLIVVVLALNLLPTVLQSLIGYELKSTHSIVIALFLGIITVCLMNLNKAKVIMPAINNGATSSLMAIMNTAAAVGFGSVVKAVPGFELLTTAMLSMSGSILFAEAVAINVLAGATGSASGGMTIALEALAENFMAKAEAINLNPEYLHRIASLASGGLDTLPHNGAVLTLLSVSNCSHKESYWDICVTSCIIPVIASILLSLVWGIFI